MNSSISHTVLTFFVQHQNELISFALTLLGALVLYSFRARVKLTWGRANNNFFQLEAQQGNPAITLYSEKHYVQNVGRVPAKEVNVVFSQRPDSISIWQTREYSQLQLPNGSYIVTIPYIAPRELLIIDSLWITPNHGQVEDVRCADALGKRVEFWVQRNYGAVFNIFAILLFVLGFYYAIVLLLRIVGG